jgi:hypothetical protein
MPAQQELRPPGVFRGRLRAGLRLGSELRTHEALFVTPTIRLPELNRYHDRTAATPLVPVCLEDAGPIIWCKLEFLNSSASTKDRLTGLHRFTIYRVPPIMPITPPS